MAQQTEPKKDSKQVVVELTMTLEEARQFVWQGTRAPREPMGKLLDSKQLDRGDLGWAIDCGDPGFREAARTLLAHSIGQPGSLRFGPEVVEGSQYLEERERESLIEGSMLVGSALAFAVMFAAALVQTIFSYIIPQLNSGNIVGVIFVVLFSGVGLTLIGGYLFRRIRRLLQSYRDFRIGREGEDEVVERLRTTLDNCWTIFRNLHLPGHSDDIDIVLVGPCGVWAVEVKSSRFTIKIEGRKWELQVKGRWTAARNNPSDQITAKARLLNDFLKRQGITRWVERAIALASPQPISNFDLSEIPVWLLPTIEERVDHLSTRIPPTQKETQQIVAIFKDLATKQIAIEEAKYQ